MPDKSGWHSTSVEVGGTAFRWHYCPTSEADALVLDTPSARKEHLRECGRAARRELAREAARRRRENTRRLAEYREMQAVGR